jgi:hypothetical protein
MPIFIRALFTIAKIWSQPNCPSMDKLIKKTGHTYNGILSSHKKNEILLFVTAWISLDKTMFCEISQE